MADYNEQQANGKACTTDQKKADGQSSNSFDSCGCGPVNREPRAAFHPWDPDTWECETTGTSETSSSLNAEDLQTGSSALESTSADEPTTTQPFAARVDAAENRELWQDLVQSQEPRDPSETQAEPMSSLPETAAKPAMQWTLVDLGTASCDKPGCDPAECDSEDCEDVGQSTTYQEQPEYASRSPEPVVSYRFDLDAEPGPAPEPMSARNQTPAEPVMAEAAEPKKRGAKRGAKKAAETAVFPEQTTPAADPAKPKRAAAKKGGKKAAAKKPAKGKKVAKKTTAKKGAKKAAKKPTTPRGKKAANGSSATPMTNPMLPTEKAA